MVKILKANGLGYLGGLNGKARHGGRVFLFNSLLLVYGVEHNYYANYFGVCFWRKSLWGLGKIFIGVIAGG
jgi:hypothetical protein